MSVMVVICAFFFVLYKVYRNIFQKRTENPSNASCHFITVMSYFTVTVHFITAFPAFTVITVFPFFFAVILPLDETTATDFFEEEYVILLELPAGYSFGFKVFVFFTLIVTAVGIFVIFVAVILGTLTVTTIFLSRILL